MKFRAVVFDIDGVLVEPVSSWRYLHEQIGIWDALACRYQEQFLAGRITYRRFCELDAAHWKGLSEQRVRRVFDAVPYARNAVDTVRELKKHGLRLIALSTGLQFIPDRIRKDLGFARVVSNRLVVRNGLLTGGVTIRIPHDGKGRALKAVLHALGLPLEETVSVGDSAGDIPMMRATGHSIAFNALCPETKKVADHVCRTRDLHEVLEHLLSLL